MRKLIYIGDPMCSWCYGFAPVMSHIHQTYQNQLEMSLIVGGLYTGGTTFQDDQRIAFLQRTWRRISDQTGQQFDFSILDKKGWLYDTELSCRAVVAIRRISPGKTFDYFHLVQKNFYANGLDSQSEDTFSEAARNLEVDETLFLEELRNPDCIEETRQDFLLSKQMGVTGFPTVVLHDDRGWSLLTAGYQPLEVVEPALQQWLNA